MKGPLDRKLSSDEVLCEEQIVILTQVVVDEVGRQGWLLVLPASIHAGIGIRRIHWENVRADAH